MLHYKCKNEECDNNVYIPECCPKPPSGDTKGCDCCYDNWTSHLKITTADLKKWSARADRRQQLYNLKSAWRDKLKAWYSDLETVDEKAEDIARKIELFIAHLNKICFAIQSSNKAIEILFCMIEDLYIRVDELKEDYDDLMNCIACAGKTNPELTPGTGIIVCLTDYGKKLDAVIATRDNLLQLIASVIEIAYKLHEYVCLNERHCGEDRIDYGLINILMHWRRIFNGEIDNNHGDCQFQPYITFPIDASEYYQKLRTDYDNSKEEVKELKRELDHALERKAAFQASQDGLNKALAEVTPDVKCK